MSNSAWKVLLDWLIARRRENEAVAPSEFEDMIDAVIEQARDGEARIAELEVENRWFRQAFGNRDAEDQVYIDFMKNRVASLEALLDTQNRPAPTTGARVLEFKRPND